MGRLGSRVFLSLIVSTPLSAIPQSEFADVNHSIIDAYAPIVSKKLNAQLELREIWLGFGGAFQVDSALKPLGEERFVITLTGDIAQNPFMSMDGYAFVACHEMGHLLAQGPKQKSRPLSKWSAVEGEADYYTTNECMWRYVNEIEPRYFLTHFDRHSIERCEEAYGHDARWFLSCMRIMSGIVAMQNYFNNTTSHNNPVSIHRHDPAVVEKTLERYPTNQCRIDIFMAGLFNQPRPACYYKN